MGNSHAFPTAHRSHEPPPSPALRAPSPPSEGERDAGCTAIELSPAEGPHWQALNLNPNRNLARLRFLEIKSKITIKIAKKPFRLNSMAVGLGWGSKMWFHPTVL